MSDGHYDYKYNRLNDLADDIERDFLHDDRREEGTEHYDYLSDATNEQKIIILKEVKKLIKDLRRCAGRAKALEWYTSGDFGAEAYVEAIKKTSE